MMVLNMMISIMATVINMPNRILENKNPLVGTLNLLYLYFTFAVSFLCYRQK